MKTAFPPLVSTHCKILILGSMPGEKSLTQQEYYAHPQNAFWWIMEQLLAIPSQSSYAQRTKQLNQKGIALWDVLHQCEREGSLDSSIQHQTAKANNFQRFLAQYPDIQTVFFNGKSVENLFKRHVQRHQDINTSIPCITLPSTSPANARLRREQKSSQWQQILEYLS